MCYQVIVKEIVCSSSLDDYARTWTGEREEKREERREEREMIVALFCSALQKTTSFQTTRKKNKNNLHGASNVERLVQRDNVRVATTCA